MPQLTIVSDGRTYRVSPDDAVAPANRLRALIAGQLVDELTREAPRVRAELMVREGGFVSNVSSENVFAVAGIALRQFSFLAAQNYQVNLILRAAGYIPVELTATIPQTPAFPGQLPPLVDFGKVLLHREPVVVAGCVVQNTPASSPIAGATVHITGVWPTLPAPNVAFPPADPPNFVSLRGKLYSARGVASDKARTVSLSPTSDPVKVVAAPAAAGESRLVLDNRVGLTLTGGEVLSIDFGSSAEEFVKTILVRGASTADQPAEVTLASALANSHRRGAIIRRMNPLSPAADKALTRVAIAGDSVLFLSDLTGWAAANTIEVHDPAVPAGNEYHAISRFTATTNVNGFYRLPPISRVAMLELEAQGPGPVTATVTQNIDYNKPINQVDFRL